MEQQQDAGASTVDQPQQLQQQRQQQQQTQRGQRWTLDFTGLAQAHDKSHALDPPGYDPATAREPLAGSGAAPRRPQDDTQTLRKKQEVRLW